jgi:hypothetical protein
MSYNYTYRVEIDFLVTFWGKMKAEAEAEAEGKWTAAVGSPPG